MDREGLKGASSKAKRREKRNEWLFVNPYLVAGVVGASFCFAWFFSVLTTSDFVAGPGGTSFGSSLLHPVFVAALLFAYAVLWLLSNRLQTHRVALAVISLV